GKGAFTGAASRKPGRVELAEGGTLFLDEIGDITPAVQVKLLRLLQDRAYERLGGTRTLAANVRFVTATHRDLEAMVKAGQFREDLFYRLNVVPIWLPPLRDRPDDPERLVQHFCAALPATGRNSRSRTWSASCRGSGVLLRPSPGARGCLSIRAASKRSAMGSARRCLVLAAIAAWRRGCSASAVARCTPSSPSTVSPEPD